MSPQLRKSIQNFLTDYQNKLTELSKLGLNGYEWDDSNTWLEKATRLLQQSIVEDYKIPEDYSWAGLKNGVIVELARDSLSLHHDHIDEIIPIRLEQ